MSLYFVLFRLGDVLLEKETINLPDIVKVLGQRPYGMSETVTEYLEELTQRQADDTNKAEEAEAEAAQAKLDEDSEAEDAATEDKGEEIIGDKETKDDNKK